MTQLHLHYGKRVLVVMDRLHAHRKAANWFAQFHPSWFSVEYLPAYSPELNPVEQCWQWMKNVALDNRIVAGGDELQQNVLNAAYQLNTNKFFLRSFFKHANLLL